MWLLPLGLPIAEAEAKYADFTAQLRKLLTP